MAGDPTIVAIGDSAMWTTGTAYRYKTPNLVHKRLTGDPIPPVQFRARGGAVIGKDKATSNTSFDGTFDQADDTYVKSKYSQEFNQLNPETTNRSDLDERNINDLKWSIVRDIGHGHPTVLEQLDQFAPGAGPLEVPWDGSKKVRFYDAAGGTDTRKAATDPPNGEDVDIVLLNGGTNDIGLGWLMNFTNHTYFDVIEAVEKYCYRHQKHLLTKARDRFPNALLVLVGYPIFISEWTSYPKGKRYLRAFAYDFGKRMVGTMPTHLLIERVIDGGMVFARAHQHYMRKAVAERSHVEARNGDPGVMYVSRGFGTINAYQGPDPWGWGTTNDDTFERRKHFVLDLVQPTTKYGRPKLKPKMLSAAIGHPNRKGSRKTADAIVSRLRDRRSLEVGTLAGKLDRRPNVGSKRSLKDALGSQKLFPNSFNRSDTGSVRHALSHRYVDSIQLTFHVDTTLKHADWWESIWRTNHLKAGADVYLDVRPGRNGTEETFRVDYESDRNEKDTPQFDRHANNKGLDRDGDRSNDRIVTEVNIDPMGGRGMETTVHTNYGKSRTQKEDNVPDNSQGWDISWTSTNHGTDNELVNDKADFQPSNRWDDERLMLWQVDEARVRVTDPGFWAVRRVELTINGELTYTKRRTNHGDLEQTFEKATENDWSTVEFDMLP